MVGGPRSGGHDRGNPATLPFYTSGVIGFSGVNYALKVAACDKKPRDRVALVFGLVPVPARFAFWADLCVNTLISPSSGTFAAHFAGCLAGLITVYAPKMVRGGVRAGARRRLGGRYLRGDERGGDAARRPVSRLVTSGNDGTGRGRRLGTRDETNETRARFDEVEPSNTSQPIRETRRRLSRSVCCSRSSRCDAPRPEGAPLVVHAGFAVGCVLLQQIMARHAPGGYSAPGSCARCP